MLKDGWCGSAASLVFIYDDLHMYKKGHEQDRALLRHDGQTRGLGSPGLPVD